MHILTLVLTGFALLSLFVLVARWMGRSLRALLPVYLAVWCVISLVNAWIGVTQAGYSVAEEALVFLPIFGIPALAAIILARRGD